MQSLPQSTTTTQEPVIAVYCNPGQNAAQPWIVGLKVGRSFDAQYGEFRSPIDAIRYALDVVSKRYDLPVIWPSGIVLPQPVAVSWNA